MSKRTLLTQALDDDGTRLTKLLEWAKNRHIWIHDDVAVGKMSNVRLDSGSDPKGAECVLGKRKAGKGEIVGEGRSEKRHITEEDMSYGVSRASVVMQPPNSELSDHIEHQEMDDSEDMEENYDERARGTGFGMYIKPNGKVLERQVVVLIPKLTMLSARTSSLSPHIAQSMLFSSDASSGLLLNLVLLHEFLLGENGPWWGYLQSLPRHEDGWGIQLPLLLNKGSEAWMWMDKTEVGRMIRRVEADPGCRMEGLGMSKARLQSFFESRGLDILKQAHPGKDLDSTTVLQDYLRLYSLISSRTFVVDMYHGMCLVPIADMFNHSEASNMHFEADDEVCDECGSLGSCPHNSDPLPSTAYGRPSAFLPAVSGPNSMDWSPPETLKDVDTVDMVAQKTIKGEDEAYNTYGNFSNANLLTTYGFCLEYQTPWDRYVWDWRYTGEREELLQALNLYSASQEDQNAALEAWKLACSSFSELPFEFFDEMLSDYSIKGSEDNSTINKLPQNSPFVALAKPIEDFEAPGEPSAINERISDAIADLSNHDGSKDKYQPFFIDSEGRISVALFRAFVLAQLAIQQEQFSKDKIWSKAEYLDKATNDVRMVERHLALLQNHIAQANESNAVVELLTEYDQSWATLESTVHALTRLVGRRLEEVTSTVKRPYNGHLLDGISSLLEKESTLQRSAALQAWQEFKALSICNEGLQEFSKIISMIPR